MFVSCNEIHSVVVVMPRLAISFCHKVLYSVSCRARLFGFFFVVVVVVVLGGGGGVGGGSLVIVVVCYKAIRRVTVTEGLTCT